MQGLFQRFFSLYRPLVSKLNELLGEYNLSYSLWQVIYYLKNNGPSSLVDIANYYNIEKPSVTRRVNSLEEKLMVRAISSKDKREKIIELTE
ncbi:MarR family transcriptional regulator, partial [Clostridium sp.]|uniref:MarR family winged helix-turn-helix transcriptional regulator n=1 Tax=Clostridium sp. TaxID=1506 RepID=UPI003216701D